MASLNDFLAWLPSWQGTAAKLEAHLARTEADLANNEAALVKATSDLSAALKTVGDQAEQIKNLRAELEAKSNEVVALTSKAQEIAASTEKQANVKAVEIVAKVGVEPVAEEKQETGNDLLAQYEAVKNDPIARAMFLHKHAEQIKTLTR